ncbi:hypothetical protein PBI_CLOVERMINNIE_84 [Gordonia phage CloverMinnie]|nr:hypothetical protein PBI_CLOVERMINNIE_84 [Gordonia phage CloverMinnie]UBF41689.1 hypothetical protein SEA_ANARQUE_86 [Gordonia phage AnarQue]UOW93069.1 hypothetical protein SEA_CAIB_85 [Gordonia phage CaiB]WAB09589.1 hypothetical protein SEA_WOOPER_86 [Gordonia phage Wooper]WNM74976.1 hypothetical protein SEA_MOSSROSE_84 [Gordonia phage MossRose]
MATLATDRATEADVERFIDQFILADTRIEFGNAQTEDEWMRWHNQRDHAAIMIASCELELRDSGDTRPFSAVL